MISKYEHFSDLFKADEIQSRPAIICQEVEYTYGELRQAVELCASDLVKLGVKEDDHVGLWAYNSINWVINMMAIVRIGAVAVLANYSLPSKYNVPMMRLTDVRFLSYGLNRETKNDLRAGDEFAKMIGVEGRTYCFADMDYKARILSGELPLELPEDNFDTHKDAVIIFTSGTTSLPKAVLLSQKSILNNGFSAYKHLDMEQDKCEYSCLALPLFHSYGLTVFIGTLQLRSPICIISSMKPDVIIDEISKYQVSLLYSVGILNKGMLASPRFNTEVASYLRKSVLGGEFADPKTIIQLNRMYPDITFLVGYGQSEAGPIITLNTPWDSLENIAYTVGIPMGGTKLRIIDINSGINLDIGEIGEVLVKSDSMMNGYYKLPPEKQAIDSDGWLHTGDLGFLDKTGHLCLTGRLKDIIIKNGENISPREIEDAMLKCDGIKSVHVMGTPSKTFFGDEIDACLVMMENYSFDEMELRSQLSNYLPKFKIPEHFFLFEKFPLNENGKVNVRELREMIHGLLVKN